MTFDAHLVASDWLSSFSSALARRDVCLSTTLFLPDGWLRDVFTLTWDIRTLEGQDKIAAYLSESLAKTQIINIRLDETPDLAPRVCTVPLSENMSSVQFGFQFELPHGHGCGLARLVEDPNGTFRAFTVLLALCELRGHEEFSRLPFRDDLLVQGRDPEAEYAEWIRQVETEPHVLIVGGGQSGLDVAARFKQMNIPSLVIEKNARVGDNWRKRYPSVTLHSIRRQHTMLYQPFPSTWPDFSPRDKLAGWLEQYVITQDLVVWTKSELQAHPQYDEKTGQWEVIVVREGVEVKLRPSHIIMATGMLGRPLIPAFIDVERFRGQYMHSSKFPGGALFAGKRAVIIGAGESSIDICQDLVLKGANSVTMIQRSSSCVIRRDFFNNFMKQLFPEDEPMDVSDLKFAAMPLSLQTKLMVASRQSIIDAHEDVYEKLRKGGFSVIPGPDGGGTYVMYYTRGGGYWLDKGGAELIGNGRIKVKHGTVDRFIENGLVLSDGTELLADVVVFATGYTSMRESNAEVLGPEIMKHVGPVGGRDEDGEVNGLFRQCGHPGLWFAGGDFFYSRFFSKQLGLQIQAIQSGILDVPKH
ncbi:dimethylaniline monooxygenase (N-oxide-forming) [Lentinus tigrinus ALCF2SS1-7]|uniref:Dimethylaniline monooxygenase (N-oxide-forming) n=1 Tax=Lentinus tigrinus ALCF2SS1-6 TaxID=1328759 RepID=A0A5C2RRL7_9APHY|nr:dimethylaniline monooxygenase (N-oxide-forming) [Lentinus tigrinus ALCF2SS1-6]RPD70559.1 dimethylaniline monooxygenase (N-oxide-forming) [Lentinus tigrinus ALCF2SS1-7]